MEEVEAIVREFLAPVSTAESAPTPVAQAAPTPVHGEAIGVPASADETVRVGVDVLDALVRQVGELVLSRNRLGRLASEHRQFEPPPETLTGSARSLVRGAYQREHRLLLALDIESALQMAPPDSKKRVSPQGDRS